MTTNKNPNKPHKNSRIQLPVFHTDLLQTESRLPKDHNRLWHWYYWYGCFFHFFV